MTIKQKMEILEKEKNTPCVTISMNTHRTHPDNDQDVIQLKNLLKEAEERVINEFGKKTAEYLLEKLSAIETDVNYNLDSLHIFLSNDVNVIIKSPLETPENWVQISDTFDISPLIKSMNRSEEYFILLLSQSGVSLYDTVNDGISNEIKNEDFPFSENTHFVTDHDKRSDSKLMDNMVREYFNKVDKAVIKMFNETGLNTVVICTEDNYSRLMQVADKPEVYLGLVNIDYNRTDTHHIAKQAWELVEALQHKRRAEAISEIKEAMGQDKVLTDLEEIYRASIDGRGELLLVNENFAQPVRMKNDRSFELAANVSEPEVIDDITGKIAREVLMKKGRVFFTKQNEINDLGNIALLTRY
ncbi:MAG: hypothetical protein KDD00_12510 [Ignavibacteriae bacterium]|nr:hypothetical protein [Ignavibacteriota bacterium]